MQDKPSPTRDPKNAPSHATSRSVLVPFAVAIGALTACAAALAALFWVKPESFSTLIGERSVIVERDVAYGDHPRQRLDVYRPPEGVAERPAIIVFLYGGSWSSGDKALYGFVGKALASRGFTTVIPDYRLYPEVQFPAFFDDAAAAYSWASKTIAKKCAPSRPIIIAGHSAGAHMAALLALDPAYLARSAPGAEKPAALIGLAGPYNFYPTKWPTTKDAFATIAEQPDLPRPVAHDAANAPPSLLLYGLADDVVERKNLTVMMDALTKAGAQVETHEYAGIGHAGIVLALSRPFRWRAPALKNAVDFATRITGAGGQRTCNASAPN